MFRSFWDSFLGLTSTKQGELCVLFKDTPGEGSNPRPYDQEYDALPTELSVLPEFGFACDSSSYSALRPITSLYEGDPRSNANTSIPL